MRTAVVAVAGARVVWEAWRFYFAGAQRYRLESAAILFVAMAVVVVLSRHDGHRRTDADAPQFVTPAVMLAMFVASAFALYAPAVNLGLLSDDYVLRATALAGGSITGAGGFFRPLPLILWRAVLNVSDSARALHVLNIALHGLNAWLVSVLGRRLGIERSASIAAGALFLAFPAAPEAVAWASGIQDVFMTAAVLAVAILSSSERIDGYRMAAIVTMSAAALLAKETAIAVPALIVTCWLTPSRAHSARFWFALAPVVVITIAYLLFRASMGIRSNFLVEPSWFLVKHIVVTAFGSLAVPWRAPSSAIRSWLAFGAATAMTGLVAAAALAWSRRDVRLYRALRMSLWVLAAVAPVYSYFYVNTQLEGARYLYLAECGWALCVADLIWSAGSALAPRRAVPWTACALAVGVCAFTLQRELTVWRRAADLRDRVLAGARAAAADRHCAAAVFSHIPESLDGAYVFRNGFAEAMDVPTNADAAPARCSFEWRNDHFDPSPGL